MKKSLLLLCLLTGVIAFAQPGGPATPAPIGGVEIILAAGAVYGSMKLNKRKS